MAIPALGQEFNEPEELVQKYQDNFSRLLELPSLDEACAFVGSGPSIPIGYPRLSDILTELEKEAAHHLSQDDQLNLFTEHYFEGKIPQKIQNLRNVLADDVYAAVLIRLFDKKGKEPCRTIHEDIVTAGFSCCLTTNYDRCLENAADRESIEIQSIDGGFNPRSAENGNICHVHGAIHYQEDYPDQVVSPIQSLVLSENDYDIAYEREGVLTHFLFSQFQYKSVVFLGVGLDEASQDPEYKRILKVSQQARESMKTTARERGQEKIPDRPHFAFLGYPIKSEVANGIEEKVPDYQKAIALDSALEGMGILVIRYQSNDKVHGELIELVGKLKRKFSGAKEVRTVPEMAF